MNSFNNIKIRENSSIIFVDSLEGIVNCEPTFNRNDEIFEKIFGIQKFGALKMLSKLMIVSMMFPTNLEYTLWLRRKEILYIPRKTRQCFI